MLSIWLISVTAAATFCNVAFGFDIGVVSGSLADLAASLNLTTFEQEAATSGTLCVCQEYMRMCLTYGMLYTHV